MNTIFTKESLASWITDIKEAAKEDHVFEIAQFPETKNQPFSIIAGWVERFANESEVNDLFCVSKSEPKYVMCIKVAENDYSTCPAYDFMNMPIDPETGDVDDTEVMLEWDDNPEYAAEFFMHEWERFMETYGEED